MKIFTDIQNVFQGKARQSAVPARNRAPELDITTDRNSIRATPAMRNAVREFRNADGMSEALNIAQIASAVIQRAIELSSRLRNIALDAMATNRLNTGAVEEINAEFRSALQGVPEKYSALLTTPQMRPDASVHGVALGREIDAFRKASGGMMENPAAFEAAAGDLQTLLVEKGRQLNGLIGELSGSLEDMAGRFSTMVPGNAYARVLMTADMIMNNHASAMKAQGNIVNTNVLGA